MTLSPDQIERFRWTTLVEAAETWHIVDPSYPDRCDAVAVWFAATDAGTEQMAHLSESQVLAMPDDG